MTQSPAEYQKARRQSQFAELIERLGRLEDKLDELIVRLKEIQPRLDPSADWPV